MVNKHKNELLINADSSSFSNFNYKDILSQLQFNYFRPLF